jgi:Skp family chaperone for outer membrane proteins
MKDFYKFNIVIFFLLFLISPLSANEKTAFINIDYIIKNSNAGIKVLNKIDNLNKKNLDLLEKKNKSLKELESSIINKKNIISENEYNIEIQALKQKIQDFTKEKNQIVREFNAFKNNELEKILNLFKPIISDYMRRNSINILIDSKNVFMANNNSNITEIILKEINKQKN